jgi:microcystin-dependent protein
MFAGNFAPAGWNFCDGSLLPIDSYQTLFQLIGTTYGGNGQSTFGLPDLRGRLPIHQGGGFTLGQNGGVEQVTLTVPQIPVHTHPFFASTAAGNAASPLNNVTASAGAASAAALPIYFDAAGKIAMGPNSIGNTGGSQPHSNFQPYLCVDFIISLFGVYPSQ